MAVFQAEGRDIYGQGLTVRNVYEVQAVVRPGNSGGPLVQPDGEVIGVVFSRSTTNGDIGYALTSPGVLSRVVAGGVRFGADRHRCLRPRLTADGTQSAGHPAAAPPGCRPTRHGNMTLSIEDYGIIGDLHTAALVGPGRLDRLAVPAPLRFGRLLCQAPGQRGPRIVEAGSQGLPPGPPTATTGATPWCSSRSS